MSFKDFWAKTANWLKSQGQLSIIDNDPDLDNQGLLAKDVAADEPPVEENNSIVSSKVTTINSVNHTDKTQSMEKLQNGFIELISQLRGINDQLNKQTDQHQNLLTRMAKIPDLLENFPFAVTNQQKLTELLVENIEKKAIKDEQFIDTVQKIPLETSKQTAALISINRQLAAVVDTNVQIADNFNKFNEVLLKLDKNTQNQAEGISQMTKTFTTSDRYLKYLITKQNKRFMWLFIASLTVCMVSILILTVIIVYS